MEYVTNLMDMSIDPVDWARRREAQGWDFVSVADHFFGTSRTCPHLWTTVGAIAAATSTVGITTAFVNNLFRSPVEVAQAALSAQHISGGRFELGLGAGWMRAEIDAAGLDFPEPRDRAGAFVESARIIGSLLRDGACSFDGRYYQVDIELAGAPGCAPPPLVGAIGGPRTTREVTPLCDRVEIKPASKATRGGSQDLELLATVTEQDLVDLVDGVRAIDPEIGIGMMAMCGVGDDPATRRIEELLGDGLYGRFFGSPSKVAASMEWLETMGISRCQISAKDDSALDLLAPLLCR
ncbi:MAG: LLM class flavin-dependent oxidoreductase [Acidimicrobiales bacterium]